MVKIVSEELKVNLKQIYFYSCSLNIFSENSFFFSSTSGNYSGKRAFAMTPIKFGKFMNLGQILYNNLSLLLV